MEAQPNGISPVFQFQPRASDLLHHVPHTMDALREHEDPRLEQELTHLTHMLEQRDRQVENFLSASRGRNFVLYQYTPGVQVYSNQVVAQFGGSVGQVGDTWIIPCTLPTVFAASPILPSGFGTVWVEAVVTIGNSIVPASQTFLYVDQPQIMAERIPTTGVPLANWIFERSLQRAIPKIIVPPPAVGLDIACVQPNGFAHYLSTDVVMSGVSLFVGYSS